MADTVGVRQLDGAPLTPRDRSVRIILELGEGLNGLELAKRIEGEIAAAVEAALAQERVKPSDDSWLIFCTKEPGRGDVCLWWAPGGAGYTRHLEEAGRFTRERVEAITRGTPGAMAVPTSHVARVRTVVRLDDLPGSWDALRRFREEHPHG